MSVGGRDQGISRRPPALGVVEFWFLRLHPRARLPTARALLTPDELDRAGRFRFEVDRDRYVWARWALRRILGLYLHCDPAEIRFKSGVYGKPSLSFPFGPNLGFNVSHAGGAMAVGIVSGAEVGVDLEPLRRLEVSQFTAIALSPTETSSVTQSPNRSQAFIETWTRKEAYLKAVGRGIGIDLTKVTTGGEAADNGWRVISLRPCRGYVAAVACPADIRELRCVEATKYLG